MADSEHVSTGTEAPSDADWSADRDGAGMDMNDAVESTYNDWDRDAHGIAEGERSDMGRWLKGHADHVGLSVVDGLKSVIEPAAILHNGSLQQKRQLLGETIDQFQIHPEPGAETAQYDEFGDPVGGAPMQSAGQVIQTAEQAAPFVQQFIQQNPAAADPAIQDIMLDVAADMQRQGFQPDLPTMLYHAVASQQAQDAETVARAKAADVQVSGGGHSAPSGGPQSDDISDVLNEITPRW